MDYVLTVDFMDEMKNNIFEKISRYIWNTYLSYYISWYILAAKKFNDTNIKL